MNIYSVNDVIVAGGGTAGLVAAISAARNGVSTIIIERQGFLGGTMTGSLLPHMQTFHDATGKQIVGGIAQEIVDELIKKNGAIGHLKRPPKFWGTDTPYDIEVFKLIVEKLVEEAGIKVLYHTFLSDVLKENDNLKGVIIENKSGRQVILGKIVIDATGDGDVAVKAGCIYEQGRTEDGLCQPVSFHFKLANVDMIKFANYIEEEKDMKLDSTWGNGNMDTGVVAKKPLEEKESYVRLIGTMPREAVDSGQIPEDFAAFTVESIHENIAIIGHPHVLKVDATNAEELTKANIEGRKRVWEMTRCLKKYIPGFERAFVLETPQFIGVRETRRIIGEYVLTVKDVKEAKRFDDNIAFGAFPIDIHPVDQVGRKKAHFEFLSSAYGIPYRCLVPKKVDQLLISGRCISTTHEANASTRVTPTCMATGEAAGAAATICAKTGVKPRKLDYNKLRIILKDQGSII